MAGAAILVATDSEIASLSSSEFELLAGSLLFPCLILVGGNYERSDTASGNIILIARSW